MFKKILVANRGEIALRIIRACREMGIKTVAVHSEADADSLHVRYADEAICIGPAPVSKSYLNIPAIITAAEITAAEAIHPGYGFLAENAHFGDCCAECHIKFIGPSPVVIRKMGDKVQARLTMQQAGVPVVPGSDGVIKSEKEAIQLAQKIGYPVIIKAAAGGGGKGIRIAHTDVSLVNTCHTAMAEAETAFGNPDIYIEKYMEEPRHVEIQILGDEYGNIHTLGERDCTIQRRYQKLIEESPSPALTPELRARIAEMAHLSAKSVNYTNAGTVEFLLDRDNKFYFMEVNTRIQVEHPVTEMVTGLDIVKEQIRSAAGQEFLLPKRELGLRGHAIECRINAEDPDRNFAPSPGKIIACHFPGGPGIRVDTHIYAEYEISQYYDSLLAKLIAHGQDRAEAISRMERALDEFIVEGVKTTIPFHKRVLTNPLFRRGEISTHFIEHLEEEEK